MGNEVPEVPSMECRFTHEFSSEEKGKKQLNDVVESRKDKGVVELCSRPSDRSDRLVCFAEDMHPTGGVAEMVRLAVVELASRPSDKSDRPVRFAEGVHRAGSVAEVVRLPVVELGSHANKVAEPRPRTAVRRTGGHTNNLRGSDGRMVARSSERDCDVLMSHVTRK